MNVVSCPHCGTKYRADYEKIPVSGKTLKCGKCGDSFGVLKNDEYYKSHFSQEMSAYILHRKYTGQIANLKYDLNRLQILETYLNERKSSLVSATPEVIQDFLKEITQRFSAPHVRGVTSTIREFYTLLTESGLIAANPAVKPASPSLAAKPAPLPSTKTQKTPVKCPRCSHLLEITQEEIPPFGECAACSRCNLSFPLMKPDEFYTRNYSPPIAAYLLHRKNTKNIANLEFDMRRLEEMEKFLAKEGRSLTGVNAEEIRHFLKRLEEKLPREQVDGFHVTITDFFNVLTKLGLIAKHQVNHPSLLESAQVEAVIQEIPSPPAAPPITTTRMDLRRRRRPLIAMMSGMVALLLGVALFFFWYFPSQDKTDSQLQKSAPSSSSEAPTPPAVSLYTAARQGLSAEIRAHLRAKSDPNVGIPPFNDTPLHAAAQLGQKEATRLLLSAGADPNQANVHGSTPLHKAATANQIEIVQLLLEARADIGAINEAGRTPLYEAMQHGTEPLIALLIQAGSDVNYASNNGTTPLHRAASEGNVAAIKLLVKAGGNLSATNQRGETPLQVAEQAKQLKAVGTLQRAMKRMEGASSSPP